MLYLSESERSQGLPIVARPAPNTQHSSQGPHKPEEVSEAGLYSTASPEVKEHSRGGPLTNSVHDEEETKKISDDPSKQNEDGQLMWVPSSLKGRTPLCKHKHSCLENVLLSFASIFKTSFALKLLVNNLMALGNPKKLIKQLTSWKSNKDCLQFAVFAALMNAMYKAILCLLRRILKNDKVSAPIAGFLAGLCSVLEAKNRRSFMMILLMSRASDTTFRAAVARNWATSYIYGNVLLFVLTNVNQQYFWGVEKDLMNKSIWKFMTKWSLCSPNFHKMVDATCRSCSDDIFINYKWTLRLR